MAAWTEDRIVRLRAMWPHHTGSEIASELGTSRGAIYVKANALGLERKPRGRAPGSSRRVNGLPAGDRTGQRRFTGVEPGKGQRIRLQPHHPALRNGSTIFGLQVVPAIEAERLFKSGEHNRKIGGQAAKGRWKGMPIYTLTLEERATCPRSCKEWATCYGNNMGHAPRIHDDGWLLTRLAIELHQLQARHPGGFIIRLHVLGDFASLENVTFWRNRLAEHPGLHLFGFTARLPATDIGAALVTLMQDNLERVALRWSGVDLPLHCSEVVDRREDARYTICPAELDADRCCATCGLCWQSENSISFLRH